MTTKPATPGYSPYFEGLNAALRGDAAARAADGAVGAVVVDLDALDANIAALRCADRCDVRAASVLTLGPARQPLDLVMLDPPYGTGAGAVAIERLARLGWIGEATWICLETAAKEIPDVRVCTLDAERKVGKALLSLMRLKA